MTEFTAHYLTARLPRPERRAPGGLALGDARPDRDRRQGPARSSEERPTGRAEAPTMDELIQQTWAEMEEARDRYQQDARRLRLWQWWFVGMFTFYTTLVGILVLKLLTSQ
jgi:hypothetical protein